MSARLRLASRWASRAALWPAYGWLLLLALLAFSHPTSLAVFLGPFILLAPLAGGLGRRGAALVAQLGPIVAVLLLFVVAILESPVVVIAFLVVLLALSSPAISSATFADADAAGWAPVRTCAVAATLAAMAVAAVTDTNASLLRNAGPALLFGLLLLGLIVSLPVGVLAEPKIGPAYWAGGFFRATLRVLRDKSTRGFLLASALFHAFALAGAVVILAPFLTRQVELFHLLTWLAVGLAVGAILGGLNGHPCRCLGRVPVGLTGLAILLLRVALWDSEISASTCLFLGVMAGLVSVPLQAGYQQVLSDDIRTAGLALRNAATAALMGLVLVLLYVPGVAPMAVLTGVAVVGAVVAWGLLYVEVIETLTEWLVTPLYRIRAFGPGAGQMPRRRPLLVVANHAAWGDPFWVAKIVPRHVCPMMTSVFFDLPVVRWLMIHVVGAIRVPSGTFRREAPELAEAVAVLRNGECVAIFPEGGMRRSEEQLLRPFGQGVWHILHELPQTPVVVCWIEGGWGSYTSYFGGRPTKNKRMDWRRPIHIGVAEPEVLPAEVLADRQRTREYLRRRCLECRGYLGLEVPAEGEAPSLTESTHE